MSRKKQKDRIQQTVHFRKAVHEFVEQQRRQQEFDMSFSCMADLIIYRVLREQEEKAA